MSQSVAILGRQPGLGLAELESLYGPDKIRPIGSCTAVIDLDHTQVNFARLGGTIKFCKVLTTLDSTDWKSISTFLFNSVPAHATALPEGKLRLGLSVYDLSVNPKQLLQTGLEIKKLLKQSGRSMRLVPNKEPALNSAQVLHNQLTSQLGWELIFIKDGKQTIVAQNIAVQDITAYAARDQKRPKRDARVGMLPPKLAQIIINLAVGQPRGSQVASHKSPELETIDKGLETTQPLVVLDPFCGTGVVLQEAMLMGYNVYGTDLEPRMIDYSKVNLDWLKNTRYYKYVCGQTEVKDPVVEFEVGDATNFIWNDFDTVACETYLGRPFSATPSPDKLQQVMQDVDTILRKFLKNLAKQTKPGFRACVAMPAWKTPHGIKHLKTLDSLGDLGYTRQSFVHANVEEMVYHRPEQIVARELVVLTRT